MLVSFPLLAILKMEEVLQNVVTLVKENQNGIPVKKLGLYYNQKYRSNLSPRALNFSSMLSMVSTLEDLVVRDNLVLHKDHCQQSQAETGDVSHSGASAAPLEDIVTVSGTLERVVALMMEHPEGILLKNVEIYYNQMYHQKLSVTSLGFKTIARLVKSLKKDLVVKEKKVFHKIYLPENQPGPRKSTNSKEDGRPRTLHTPESLASPYSVLLTQADLKFGAPLAAFSSASSAQRAPGNLVVPVSTSAQQLTQDQLYQQVLQVSSCMLTNMEALCSCIRKPQYLCLFLIMYFSVMLCGSC